MNEHNDAFADLADRLRKLTTDLAAQGIAATVNVTVTISIATPEASK